MTSPILYYTVCIGNNPTRFLIPMDERVTGTLANRAYNKEIIAHKLRVKRSPCQLT